MKIYIVIENIPYEGGDIVFVSKNKKKANAFMKEKPLKYNHNFYTIEEWRVANVYKKKLPNNSKNRK